MGIALAVIALKANAGDAERAIEWLHATWRTLPDAEERRMRRDAEEILRAYA